MNKVLKKIHLNQKPAGSKATINFNLIIRIFSIFILYTTWNTHLRQSCILYIIHMIDADESTLWFLLKFGFWFLVKYFDFKNFIPLFCKFLFYYISLLNMLFYIVKIFIAKSSLIHSQVYCPIEWTMFNNEFCN